MKTIVLVCVALVVLVASEARPSAPGEGSPPGASAGADLSQATGFGVGKDVATYSETGAKDGLSYAVSGANAEVGMVMSKSHSQSQHKH